MLKIPIERKAALSCRTFQIYHNISKCKEKIGSAILQVLQTSKILWHTVKSLPKSYS